MLSERDHLRFRLRSIFELALSEEVIVWWCDYSVDGVRRRESRATTDRDEALAYLHGLLFHDLLRTAVRNLRLAGVEETVVMKITGHRMHSVVERYNITHATDTREAGRKSPSGQIERGRVNPFLVWCG